MGGRKEEKWGKGEELLKRTPKRTHRKKKTTTPRTDIPKLQKMGGGGEGTTIDFGWRRGGLLVGGVARKLFFF